MTEEWRETNRAWWDEPVPAHADSAFYDLGGFREGADHLRLFEVDEVGPVEGLDLLHLQCHLGTDTLVGPPRSASHRARLLRSCRRNSSPSGRRDRLGC